MISTKLFTISKTSRLNCFERFSRLTNLEKKNIVAKTRKKIWLADFTLRNIIFDIRKNRNRATKYMNSEKIWKYHHERDYVFLKNEKMFHNRHNANSCFKQKNVANNDNVIENLHMKKKNHQRLDIILSQNLTDQKKRRW